MRIIDDLIKPLSEKLDDKFQVRKYDGISLEFSIKGDMESRIAEVKSVCKKLKINGYSIEKCLWGEDSFLLQFPDFVPEYTEEEIKDMYMFNFKWLLDNLAKNQETPIDKKSVLQGKERFIHNAINTYCRSNINPYKDNVDNYLNDIEYRKKLSLWFEQVLLSY